MAIFDPTLPIVSRGKVIEKEIKIKGFKAKTYQSWNTETGKALSVKVNFKLKKCVKKILGICVKKEIEEKWLEIPYGFHTPDFYPSYYPINVVWEEDLDEVFYLDLPDFETEEDLKKIFEKILKNHIQVLHKTSSEYGD